MIIELSNHIFTDTLPNQAAKVEEEWGEVVEAYKDFTRAQAGGNPSRDHIAEELFDLYQASARWAIMLGIDIVEANKRHIAKMARREAGIR